MSDLSLIALLPRNIAGLVFDGTYEETHYSELEITDNPVESGSAVTDHAYVKPYRLRVRVGVTNTPLYSDPLDVFGVGDSRVKTAWKIMQDLQSLREPFAINTGLKLYENMLLVSLNCPQDVNSANAIEMAMEFREVKIVNTQIVTYPPRAKGKASNNASKKKEKGEQQGKEPPAASSSGAESPQKQSVLKRVAGALGK